MQAGLPGVHDAPLRDGLAGLLARDEDLLSNELRARLRL
jgi:hypothetical protein